MGSRQAVLLVPAELALGCGGIQCAVLLDAACINIDQITVGIVSINVAVVHLDHGVRILFRAVVRILHLGELELFALSLAVGIDIVLGSGCVKRLCHLRYNLNLDILKAVVLLHRHRVQK